MDLNAWPWIRIYKFNNATLAVYPFKNSLNNLLCDLLIPIYHQKNCYVWFFPWLIIKGGEVNVNNKQFWIAKNWWCNMFKLSWYNFDISTTVPKRYIYPAIYHCSRYVACYITKKKCYLTCTCCIVYVLIICQVVIKWTNTNL